MTDKFSPGSKVIVSATLILALHLSATWSYSQTFEERVDRYINSFPRHQEFHGVVFAAAAEHVLLNKGYGLASREFDIPNSPDSRFQIGSISKAFTAILVLKMVQAGRLRLDATISDYLPYYPEESGKKITIHNLLSHTSGIRHHYIAVPDYWLRHDKVFHTPRELVSLFSPLPRAHEPGEKITYSSPGFYVLGAILEQVAKKSYAELLREYILDPLGMEDTCVENNRAVRKMTATGYMRGLGGLIRAGFEDKSTALAAGDLASTARDLYLWDVGIRKGKILSPEYLEILYKLIVPDNMFTYGGPLLSIPYENGRKTLKLNRLTGSSTGYSAAMDRLLGPDACVIVLSNVQDAETARILDDISDFLTRHELGMPIGNPAPPNVTPPSAVKVEPAEIEKVIGFYRRSGGAITGIVRGGGGIFLLEFSDGSVIPPVLELVPEGSDSFHLGWLPEFKCRFSPDKKDGPLVLTTSRGNRILSAANRIEPDKTHVSEYEGHYSSVELQKTFKFSQNESGLVAEKFLGEADIPMIPLEKDIFGCELGFLSFHRYPDGSISGFKIMTYNVDTYFGSRFIKI
jgi:CubicO group peptidase (beta-lactamase class C family)